MSSSTAAALKAEIKAIGFANAENEGTRQRVRPLFDDRIARLKATSAALSEDAKIAASKGAWHQIWSDEDNPQVQQQPGVTSVDTQVYQAILENGVGYNFGLRRGPFGPPGADGRPTDGEAIFIIRFDVSQGASSKIVTFTNTYARPGRFKNLEQLTELAGEIERCRTQADGTACLNALQIRERQAPRFPNGPIGSQSPLFTDYIDGDFRVVTVPNSVTNHLDLFILERTRSPVLDLTYQERAVVAEKNRLEAELRDTAGRLQRANDHSPAATTRVTQLVEQLSLLSPPNPEVRTQLGTLVGGWQLLWSNENVVTDTQAPPARVYQLVTPSYIFNLGERTTPQGTAVFALRTPITPLPDGFRIKFDKAYARPTGLVEGEPLSAISTALEGDAAAAGFTPRSAPSFPNGPIGATDDLRNLYLDGQLRVTMGRNATTQAEEIFVLERATRVR